MVSVRLSAKPYPRPIAPYCQLNPREILQWKLTQNAKLSCQANALHYDDVIMTMLASQITSLPVVCSIVYSDVNQRKHQSSASLAFVREIHRGPVNFPHKWPVTRKMFPFDDVIMSKCHLQNRGNFAHACECQATLSGMMDCSYMDDLDSMIYRQTSNISRTSVGNKIVDHSVVVRASSVGAVPTTSPILT